MLISTQTDYLGEVYGDVEAVRMIAEAGFDAADYSMFCMKYDDCLLNTPSFAEHIRTLKSAAEESGIFFNQAHAVFPTEIEGNEEYNAKTFKRIVRALEIGGMLGVTAVIVHPVAFEVDQMPKNLAIYERLQPYAREFGVKIALENMWGRSKTVPTHIVPNVCSTAKDFPLYVDALSSEQFTACLDIGHCYLVGDNAPDMIRALGHDRLTCLHVHDNDLVRDSHIMPFAGEIKWEPVIDALKEIDYSGVITLEADNSLKKVPKELCAQTLSLMRSAADYIRRRVEK